MNFEEYVAKSLILAPAGIAVPRGQLCTTPDEVAVAVRSIGPAVIKAQVATGKRGKAGGIRFVSTPAEAERVASAVLGMMIGEYRVERLLVEEQAKVAREFYAAVLNDAQERKPLILFATEGGMDIEEIAAANPDAIRRLPIDIDATPSDADIARILEGAGLGNAEASVADILSRLYAAYRQRDAELLEINPLAQLADGRVVALDAKFVLDDSAAYRQEEIAKLAALAPMTALERLAAEHGLKFIQLDGNVGVLANGAGLTMTTMDVIRHFGGRPANFLEIGGDAYTKSAIGLELVLSHPGVKSLVVNFCGAFARTDVMADGVVRAWKKLKPNVPAFFSIHGTGQDEAIALVREHLRIEPYDLMEDAIQVAVQAAR
jgi:succinyl-CoA synthetase beta subunit